MRYPVVTCIAGQPKADALEQMLLVTFGETKVTRRAGAEARILQLINLPTIIVGRLWYTRELPMLPCI